MSAKDKSIPEEVFIPIEECPSVFPITKDENKKPEVTKDEYVDSAIQEDVKNTPTRSLYELNEIGKLVSDQFDDMTTFNIKQEVINVG